MSERREVGSHWAYRWGKRVGLPFGAALLVGGSFWLGLSNLSLFPTKATEWPTKLIEVPPRSASEPVSAGDVVLSPNDLVVGVEFAGHHRAYPVAAMSHSSTHVMNDRMAGRPLTVAYCDRTNCARAFTTREGQSSIDLAVGGWWNEGGVSDLILRHGRYRYELKTARPPGLLGPAGRS